MVTDMASKKSYLEHLASVPLFSSCSQKDLNTIAQSVDELHVKAGTTLTAQDHVGSEAFILVSGSATVAKNGRKIAKLGPGAIIGEMSLLDRGPRLATVTTDTDSSVLVIDARHFSTILEAAPKMAAKLLANLAARLREAEKHAH
jgi:CRP/FNR family transcriptional regulator, cyclic AMP receptor protein